MNLHILWFALIGILFTGFFVLEGYDYGVGMLLPFLGRNDTERRLIMNSIGPFWDGNEVWLISAGGAMFAAFPDLYATMFSGFYPEMLVILVALIIRGAAFEFRSLHDNPLWRRFWEWMIFIGSLLPGFIWGIIIANLIKGVPIDAHMNYVGNLWYPLNPFALICGLTFVLLFMVHGAIFLSLRVSSTLELRAQRTAQRLALPTFVLVLLVITSGYFVTDVFHRFVLDPRMVPLGYLILALLASVYWLVRHKHSGWAFTITSVTIVLSAITIGLGLFPHMLISSLNPAWSLTVDNASASPYTLTVLSWLALTFIPFVLLYQGWNYWVFRKRLTTHAIGHY